MHTAKRRSDASARPTSGSDVPLDIADIICVSGTSANVTDFRTLGTLAPPFNIAECLNYKHLTYQVPSASLVALSRSPSPSFKSAGGGWYLHGSGITVLVAKLIYVALS